MRVNRITALLAALLIAGFAQANPTGPQVVQGTATFPPFGNVPTVINSPRAILNWQSFAIPASEVTRFIQQSSSSAVLNRVTGAAPSVILDALQSNPRVILLNPNGAVFNSAALIPVGTLQLANTDKNLNGMTGSDGKMELVDPSTPALRVEVSARSGKAIDIGRLMTLATKQGLSAGFSYQRDAVQASRAVATPDGRVLLQAGH